MSKVKFTTFNQDCVDLIYDVYDGTDDEMFVSPLPPVLIFHGLGDCKENWKFIASSIADRTVRKVYVADIRNHGRSPRTSNMTLEANANDLEKLIRLINEPVIIIGHSFGGMTAIYLSFHKPELVKELILIDASPIRYREEEEKHGFFTLYQMKTFTDSFPSEIKFDEAKSMIEEYVKKNIKIESFQKIIFSNIYENENKLSWKVNAYSILDDMILKKKIKKVYPIKGIFHGKVLVVHGTSNYVLLDDYEQLKKQFPNSTIVFLGNCDHWIHIVKPQELLEIMLQHLK